jgi:predicted ArsR family transcriptional regulator
MGKAEFGMATGWHQRFFQSTRGRILSLLRSAARTVGELSETLGLTHNAVRVQLSTLERDGLVRQHGVRAGTRKPHLSYELTDEAEVLFPKAYSPFLSELLAVMAARLPANVVDEILDDVGKQLAEAHFPKPAMGLEERLERIVEFLGQLGGLARLERDGEGYVLVGSSCPIAATVRAHPQACRSVTSLLHAATGAKVEEACEKGATPRCRFNIPIAARA